MKYATLFTVLTCFGLSTVCLSENLEHEAATHSAALYEGKYGTGGHAAIHRGDLEKGNRPTFALVSLWESKYVSEGRNNLDDGGLFSIEGVMEWKGLLGGVWFAGGDDENYKEVNVFLEYDLEMGPLDFSLGYARLESIEDHQEDNEFAAGVALKHIPYIIPSIDYVYSTEADGGFLEVTLQSEIAFFDERLIVEPYILQAFDFGFATESHDGRNNFQMGVGASLGLTDRFDLVGSASHSWAQTDVENEGLGDLSWGSIGLAATF
jgi:hypothetical protein